MLLGDHDGAIDRKRLRGMINIRWLKRNVKKVYALNIVKNRDT
jgi:hypothetical protein